MRLFLRTNKNAAIIISGGVVSTELSTEVVLRLDDAATDLRFRDSQEQERSKEELHACKQQQKATM